VRGCESGVAGHEGPGPDALPAVTEPSFLKTAFSFAKSSIFASCRTCSSVSNTTGPFRDASSIGTICDLKWPAPIAAEARR